MSNQQFSLEEQEQNVKENKTTIKTYNRLSSTPSVITTLDKLDEVFQEMLKKNPYKTVNIEPTGDENNPKFTITYTNGEKKFNDVCKNKLKISEDFCNNFMSEKINNINDFLQFINQDKANFEEFNKLSYSQIAEAVKNMDVEEVFNFLVRLGFNKVSDAKDPYEKNKSKAQLLPYRVESFSEFYTRKIEPELKKLAQAQAQEQAQQGQQEQEQQGLQYIKTINKLLTILVSYVNCFPSLLNTSYVYPPKRVGNLGDKKEFTSAVTMHKYKDLREIIGQGNKSVRGLNVQYNRLKNYVSQPIHQIPPMAFPGLVQMPYNTLPYGQIIYGGQGLGQLGGVLPVGHPFIKVDIKKEDKVESLVDEFDKYKGSSAKLFDEMFKNIQSYIQTYTGNKASISLTTKNSINEKIKRIGKAEKAVIEEMEKQINLARIIRESNGVHNGLNLTPNEQDELIASYKRTGGLQANLSGKVSRMSDVFAKLIQGIEELTSKIGTIQVGQTNPNMALQELQSSQKHQKKN